MTDVTLQFVIYILFDTKGFDSRQLITNVSRGPLYIRVGGKFSTDSSSTIQVLLTNVDPGSGKETLGQGRK